MRTGAIFARGSCRALMWVLALGVVTVLSTAEAIAQTERMVIVPDKLVFTPTSVDVEEGSGETFTIQLQTKEIATTQAAGTDPATAVTVTVNLARAAMTDGAHFLVQTVDTDATGSEVAAGGRVGTLEWTFTTTDTAGLVDPAANMFITVIAQEDAGVDDGLNTLVFVPEWTAFDSNNDGTANVTFTTNGRVTIEEEDNDSLGVEVSERALTVREGDTVGETYTVNLESEPSHPVTITVAVTSEVNADINVAAADTGGSLPLVFTADNWDEKQTVRVTAANDSNTLGGSATIKHTASSDDPTYNKISIRSISVKELDNVRTITLSTTADTVDEGKMVTITATLGNRDADDDTPATLPSAVTVRFARKASSTAEKSGDYKLGTLTIAANSTAGSATLEALHDADEDDEMLTLTASADGPAIFDNPRNEISVEILDDDTYTLEADNEEVAEGKEVTLTVTVKPAAALETKVMIDLYRASGATVSVAEGQDADPEDDKIAIVDEGESSAKFTLKTAKDANDSNDETIVVRAMVGSAVVGDPRTIMVLDTQAMPEFTFTLEPTFIGEADGEQSVMLMAMTNKAVTADTMVKFAVEDDSTAMNPDDYTIMPESGMIELTVEKGMTSAMTELMVTPVMDSMDEANETIKLSGWVDADGDDSDFETRVGNYAILTIIDGDSPGSGITPKASDEVEMVFSDAIEMAGGLMVGGNMVKVDMSMLFNMANADMAVMYTASSSDETVLMVSTDDSMLMLDPMMMGMSTVSVMAEPADGGMGASAVAAFSCSGACVSVNLEVMGAITFMLTGPEDMNLVEGMSAKVMVTASSAVVADTEVSLMRDGTSTAGMDDYTVEPMMATIMAGETMAEFDVMAAEDEMAESEGNMAEMLTLFLVVDDMQMTDQSVSFYLWDAAVPALPVIAQLLLAAFLALGGYRRYLRR